MLDRVLYQPMIKKKEKALSKFKKKMVTSTINILEIFEEIGRPNLFDEQVLRCSIWQIWGELEEEREANETRFQPFQTQFLHKKIAEY